MPVLLTKRRGLPALDRRKLLRRAERLLRELDLSARELSILLCGDEEIHGLNRAYRKKDRPTDVLSFSQQEGPDGHLHPELLGDVVISLETASREAGKGYVDLMDEVLDLLIHGVLHLLGQDHEGVPTAQAKAMRREQARLNARVASAYEG